MHSAVFLDTTHPQLPPTQFLLLISYRDCHTIWKPMLPQSLRSFPGKMTWAPAPTPPLTPRGNLSRALDHSFSHGVQGLLRSMALQNESYIHFSLLLFSSSVSFDSATPWMAAGQASLSFTVSLSLLNLMSIELVMTSNQLILCLPLLLLPSIFPWIWVFLKLKKNFFWLHWVFMAASRLSCPEACGILVPRPGMEPTSPALEGGFLTTGPPEKYHLNTFKLWKPHVTSGKTRFYRTRIPLQ